jgi:hypothetical protein
MTVLKQILTKQKAIAIIETCESQDHFKAASNYIDLYFKKFEDFVGYNELKQFHQEMKIKSMTP